MKIVSKEDFMKVWEDTSREQILNQFYYDYKTLREEYKKWNEIKKWLEDEIIECKTVINTILPEFEKIMPRSSGKTLLTSEYYRQQTTIKSFEVMLSKMQELEKGKSE